MSSADCTGGTGGRCEPSGHCSFVDDTCEDGFRFGEASGSESGKCVAAVIDPVDAGIDLPDAATMPQPAWLQRQPLTFNNMAHAEDLIEFPVLIVLTPDRFDYSKVQSDGQDLRFTDSNGQSLLAHEIEIWDAEGTSLIWVKPQQIDASVDTDYIYMYYDNVLADDGQNPNGVWSNGYEAVYHLSEQGDVFTNSAAPGNSGNNAGTTAVAGAVGGARLFDGTSAHIKLNNHDPMDLLQGTSGMTLTSWIKPSDLTLGDPNQGLIAVGRGGNCNIQSRATAMLGGFITKNEILTAARSLDSDPQINRLTTTANLVVDSWFLVSTVIDVDFEHNDDPDFPYGRIQVVVNDTLHTVLQTARFADTVTDTTPSACGSIGTQDDASEDFFAGIIDEVRISRVERSTVWLQAQYQSMQDNDFVRFGPAEDVVEPFGN